MSHHGMPCWYELASSDTAAAQQFYAAVLGWSWTNSNTPGMEYLMASTATGMVAGMMKVESPEQPVAWSFYTAVDDCDATAAKAQSLGAKLIVPPADIPGTGRFAVLIDPQGAGFAILQPLPGGQGGAFDQKQTGHGNWVRNVGLTTFAHLPQVGFVGKFVGSAHHFGVGLVQITELGLQHRKAGRCRIGCSRVRRFGATLTSLGRRGHGGAHGINVTQANKGFS